MFILFKNGESKVYGKDEYSSYTFYNDTFVVIRGNQWIGMYSMSEVRSIEVE